jgi:hypothetical protein
MAKNKTIQFKITDNLSGIDSYNTYLDGKWVVADYDAKTFTLTYYFTPDIKPGQHYFRVVVADERHNTAVYQVGFSR